MWRVWMALASEDIGDQHRRTTLGPLWLLVNYFAFAAAFIYVIRPNEGIVSYEAYVAIGLFVWLYLMETLTQSVSLFVREESFIKGTRLPLSVYVMRLFMQSVIRAGYALIGCGILLVISDVSLSSTWLWSLIGIGLILLATPAAITVLAFLGAFFPDSQFFVTNLMRIGMFLTPVFWAKIEGGGLRTAFHDWNPFTYFIDVVRGPILNSEFPFFSFLICCLLSLILWGGALALLGRYRRQVAFVL
jgi:ABC-type polysaccharide/polyol phosphate export permease